PLVQLATDAVAMARRIGDPDTMRFTFTNAALALAPYADLAEREPLNRDGLRLAISAGDKLMTLRAHILIGGDCAERGDLAGVTAQVDAYSTLAQELGYPRLSWLAGALRATLALWRGELEQAESLHRQLSADSALAEGAVMTAFPA